MRHCSNRRKEGTMMEYTIERRQVPRGGRGRKTATLSPRMQYLNEKEELEDCWESRDSGSPPMDQRAPEWIPGRALKESALPLLRTRQQEPSSHPGLLDPHPPLCPDSKSCTRCPCSQPASSLVQIGVESPPANTPPRRRADSVDAQLLWHC